MRDRWVPIQGLPHSRVRARLYASENRIERRSRNDNDIEAPASGKDISSSPPKCSFHDYVSSRGAVSNSAKVPRSRRLNERFSRISRLHFGHFAASSYYCRFHAFCSRRRRAGVGNPAPAGAGFLTRIALRFPDRLFWHIPLPCKRVLSRFPVGESHSIRSISFSKLSTTDFVRSHPLYLANVI